MRLWRLSLLLAGLVAALQAAPVYITVQNPGFEDPALAEGGVTTVFSGWTCTSGDCAIWHPTTAEYPSGGYEGHNVARLADGGRITQMLPVTFQRGTWYTLHVLLGRWVPDNGESYHMGFLAGDDILWDFSTPLSGIPIGEPFVEVGLSLVYWASPHFGDQLGIFLEKPGGQEANFDYVSVTEEATIPEPSSLALVLVGITALAACLRRR